MYKCPSLGTKLLDVGRPSDVVVVVERSSALVEGVVGPVTIVGVDGVVESVVDIVVSSVVEVVDLVADDVVVAMVEGSMAAAVATVAEMVVVDGCFSV